MGITLQRRLGTTHFDSPFHEAIINVLLANTFLRRRMEAMFEGEDVTFSQYNVMRILNGAHPEGYPRGEITRRMIDRAPDLTRMLDRLVRRGYVQRVRSVDDARHSVAQITPRGRALLVTLNGRVKTVEREVGRILGEKDAQQLSRLCEKLYGVDE